MNGHFSSQLRISSLLFLGLIDQYLFTGRDVEQFS